MLPYFAPLILLPAGGSLRGFRRATVAAAVGWLVAIIVLHPFNLYGGEGAVASRLFLPLYGVLWVLTGSWRRLWRSRRWGYCR